jgi:hypothetical protein
MHVQLPQPPTSSGLGIRRLIGAASIASFIALLAAIPTGSALATPSTEGTVEVLAPISLPTTPTDVLDPVLATVPLKDLNVGDLGSKQLSEMLGNLLNLKGTQLTDLVTSLTTGLSTHPNLTLGELTEGGLLGGILTLLGLNKSLTPNEVLVGLLNSASTPTEVKEVVEQLLTRLGGSIHSSNPTQLQSLLEELLANLNPAGLSSLESALGVGSLTTPELVTHLLNLFHTGTPAQLEPVVEKLLSGVEFKPSTLGGLATQLGTSVETLATDLGTTADTALPVLTGALSGGKLVDVLDGLGGLNLSLLGATTKEGSGPGGSGGSGGAGEGGTGGSGSTGNEGAGGTGSGSGGSGSGSGSGGSGSSSGTPSPTSVVVNLPASSVTPTSAAGTPTVATQVAKIRILSHKVKGHIATLVLQIPAAGKLVVSGGSVRAVDKQATKFERLTVRIPLSKAGTASLRKRHNRLQVALKASFKPTSGASSSAGVTVHFA